jgi:uncharacterized membrane protein YkgB
MKEHIYQDDINFEYNDYSTQAQIMEKERKEEQEFKKMQKEGTSFITLGVVMIIFTILLFIGLQGLMFLIWKLLNLWV